MNDERLDELAEAARNRGLKLVRSRVRTGTKRRFGKVGLTDPKGKTVFGMDEKGPTAKPEEIEDYLRNLGAKDWGQSLGVAVLPRKRRRVEKERAGAPAKVIELRPKPNPEPRAKPPPKPKPPPPPPKPKLREAKPGDAARLAELIGQLDHEIDAKAVCKNLVSLKKMGESPLVATLAKEVVGLIGVHRMVVPHRRAPVGRITVLVVAESERNQGVGRLLLDAAEQWCRKKGCAMVEVTSNDRRTAAHAFYRHMGYERTSIRFMKEL